VVVARGGSGEEREGRGRYKERRVAEGREDGWWW